MPLTILSFLIYRAFVSARFKCVFLDGGADRYNVLLRFLPAVIVFAAHRRERRVGACLEQRIQVRYSLDLNYLHGLCRRIFHGVCRGESDVELMPSWDE